MTMHDFMISLSSSVGIRSPRATRRGRKAATGQSAVSTENMRETQKTVTRIGAWLAAFDAMVEAHPLVTGKPVPAAPTPAVPETNHPA